MPRTTRRSRTVAAALAAILTTSLLSTSMLGAPGADAAPPGPFGSSITLESQSSYAGVDVAVDPSSNTAYVAWIGDDNGPNPRQVHLCVVPLKASSCSGGIKTISAIDGSSAAGIQVEVTAPGVATLVWWHQSGLSNAKVATATFTGGVLSPGVDVADAPSNGVLFDVVAAPDGQLWSVTRDFGSGQTLQLRPGLTGSPQNVTAPWMVGQASLAFSGTTPILLISQYGPISDPVYFSTGPAWGPFKAVPKTWNLGVFSDIVTTKRGVRMIASESNANYRPVVGKWTGTAFTTPALIGENKSCPALTFDLVADASGRMANVSERCGKLGIYNHPLTTRAAVTYFSSGGTISGAPQISTTVRGYALVAWAVLDNTIGANLRARWVRLPSLLAVKSAKASGNRVSVKAPVGCLTPVSYKAIARATAARGWSVVSRSLKLDGVNKGADEVIDGEKLSSGSHTLIAKAVFRKGGQRATATKKVTFKVC
jgi:hypothetical protein